MSWWRSLAVVAIVFAMFGSPAVLAQTTIATCHTNNNGQLGTTFQFTNNNAAPVIITSIGSVTGSPTLQTAQLWYSATSLTGLPGAITGPTWTQVATGTYTGVVNITTCTPQTMLSGLSFMVPGLTTYRFWFQSSGNIRYSTLTAGTYPFSGGGCTITSGSLISYGGPATGPTFTPRGFIGSVTFIPSTPCTGQPTPGNTTGPANACPGASFQIGLQNPTGGSGVSYQWQMDTGGGMTNFGTSASTQTVTQTVPTTYQCIVTCSGNPPGPSAPLTVGMNPFLSCYCQPTANCGLSDNILNVTCGTINNTTPAACSVSYTDFSGSFNTSMGQGTAVPISVKVNNGGTEYAGGWVDFNQNGTFEASEYVTLTGGVSPTWIHTGTVNVPLTATLGETRMRVRSQYAAVVPAAGSCTNWTYGETEDYKVFITTPPTCLAPQTPSATAVTANSATINWACPGCTGDIYLEYAAGTFTPGVGASPGGGTLIGPLAPGTLTQPLSGLVSLTTYNVYVRQDCGGGNFSTNTGTSFTTLLDCATSPTVACATPTAFTIPAGSGTWALGPAFCSPPGTAAGPFCTPGKEKVFQFTAAFAGTYILQVTATNSQWVDYFFKLASGPCDQTGWTYINDVFSPESANFTISTPGTYYLVADLEGTAGAAQTFQIVCPLPCATPQAPSVSNLTSTSAQINWTCTGCTGSNFIVEYGTTGFVLGTGTQINSATSPVVIPGLSPTTGYQAYVRQDCNNVGDGLSNQTNVLNFTTLAPPPVNDNCAGAIAVSCGNSYSGTNVAATNDGLPSQASGGEATIDNGVWYIYTPTVTGEQVTASLCTGTAFDSRIHIFKGSCGAPVGIAGADDVCGVQSTITWNALPGETYYIVVEGYFAAQGTFNLTITCGPLCTPFVTNDLCVDKQLITMSSNCVAFGGNLSCATNSAGNNPVCIGGFNPYPDAWYYFNATAPNAFVTLTGGANLRFVLYNGNTCVTTPEFYCSAVVTSGVPVLVTGLTQGNDYTLRVMQLAANAAPFTLCVQKLDVSDDPCSPVAVNCGDLRFGRTTGYLNNIPAGACPFNGAASTGGVNFFTYTAVADEDVTFSTCGQTAFNTRLSVFTGACTGLTCNVMNDDAAGCPNNSSEVTVRAATGQTYTIMVSGVGAANGNYQLSVFCQPYCSITEANDRCPNDVPLTTYVTGDPGAVPWTENQACSYADGPNTCSGASMVQGVWYSFNSGPNTVFDIYVAPNSVNPLYTATSMNYALYSGACTGVSAAGEVTCFTGAAGTYALPALAPNTDYRLLCYNAGGNAEGTFGLLVTHPGYNDAGISAVTSPVGTICDAKLFPVVYLKNFGENPLTSATINSRIDGSLVATYNWTGGPIPRGDSVQVLLPLLITPLGPHLYTAEVALPNGAADELASNNASSSAYDATGQTVKVQVFTDAFGAQTSWTIFDAFFFPVGQSGPGMASSTITTTELCLPTTLGNCYYFFLFDAGGDGLCCANGDGFWKLLNVVDEVVLQDEGSFTSQSPNLSPQSAGYFAHEFCLPLGPSHPLESECDVYGNFLQNKVYTASVAGVVNYQFEFSDPDKGFRRRIAVPRNWVKFGEMVSNPLSNGVTYFCRVRADQGASGFADDFFGKGCDMALASVQPICTELISTPGNTFSCGVTKAFGGSDKIYAQPVPYATQYRFNFVNTGLSYTRNILRPSYVCLLNWVTNPLVNGVTYDVKVEAYVGTQWSGFCGATCQVTIVNPPTQEGMHDGSTGSSSNDGVQLWPNPVRDGRVNLSMSGLAGVDQKITVDVYDIFGKRVMAQHFENSGETFSTVLDLDQSLAAGVYTVNITVNDEVTTKRLSVQ